MKFTARTHPGQIRPLNEDSFHLPDRKMELFIVADGMGGHLAGEVASSLAVSSLLNYTKKHEDKADELTMRAAFESANAAIYDQARQVAAQRGMGTTMSVLWVRGGQGIIGHVGDSRIYLYRDDALQLLTRDHSLVEELLAMGEITKDEARNHPHRNIITRALGTSSHERVDTQRIDVNPGDVYLLCTDGLTGYYEDAEIECLLARLYSEAVDMDALADELLKKALERGGHDNITLILAQSPGERGEGA